MNSTDFSILIADDDRFIRDDVRDLLAPCGYLLLYSATAHETFEQVQKHKPDLVLLDMKFPDRDDLSLLKQIQEQPHAPEVIILSSQIDDIPRIVEAIKLGAHDYVAKPFQGPELKNRIAKALDLRRLRNTQERLLNESRERNGIARLIGDSSSMQLVRTLLGKLADTDVCVLLLGECGTGKELAARALHDLSRRRAQPFVAVNCASIPDTLVESVLFGHKRGAFTGAVENNRGKFEAAASGTLFLDEIGDMPLAQQSALLRVLENKTYAPVGESQERESKCRIVLATNRDLKERVKEGKFREDLYFRIQIAPVTLPPLRARLPDIPLLCENLLKHLTAKAGQRPARVEARVLEVFAKHDWPGNVRELRNVLEAAVLLRPESQEELTLADLPLELQSIHRPDGKPPEDAALTVSEQNEKKLLIDALRQALGNQSSAARLLGCHRNTIRARMRYYGVS